MKVFDILICLCTLSILLSCNNNESSDNSSKKSLDELYQIFEIIQKEWPAEVIEEFKSMDEEKAVFKQYRPGIGQWLRNNYLNKKSSKYHSNLVLFFRSNGIFHREDMSAIILTCFHRKLNNKPIQLEEQVESYKKFYREQAFEVEEKKK